MGVLKKSERNWQEYREKCYQKEKKIDALEKELRQAKYEPELWITLWRYFFGGTEGKDSNWMHPGKLLSITCGGLREKDPSIRYLVFWFFSGKFTIAFRDYKDSYAEIKICHWIRIVKRDYRKKQRGWKIEKIKKDVGETCCGSG